MKITIANNTKIRLKYDIEYETAGEIKRLSVSDKRYELTVPANQEGSLTVKRDSFWTDSESANLVFSVSLLIATFHGINDGDSTHLPIILAYSAKYDGQSDIELLLSDIIAVDKRNFNVWKKTLSLQMVLIAMFFLLCAVGALTLPSPFSWIGFALSMCLLMFMVYRKMRLKKYISKYIL